MWLPEPGGGSWAPVKVGTEPLYRVWRAGRRRLFDEMTAYRWWQGAGEPAVTGRTVTVGLDGRHPRPPT